MRKEKEVPQIMSVGGYFDNSATTKPCETAVAYINKCLTENWGNPSSLYDLGIRAEGLMNEVRAAVAAMVGCRDDEVYFTSGGTESNNIALFGAANALKRRGKRIIITSVEHSSVLETAVELEKEGFEIVRLTPSENGSISLDEVKRHITADTILMSMMLVNNETGAINPVGEAAKLLKKANPAALMHCDCVQAFGKLPFKMSRLGADMISLSGHKIHGPKGIGVLIKSKQARITAHTFGGGQEKNLRPGTEPVPLIAGLLGAIKELPDINREYEKIAVLKKYAESELVKIGGVTVNSPEDGLPYILNISVNGIRSETMLHFLEEREVYVSSGSACSKGKGSYVLTEMGLERGRIDSALRISFSRYNTQTEVDALVAGISDAAARLKRR